MLKLIKWIAIILIVLVLLVTVTAAVAVATLDPNEFKPQIEAQVKKATGREFKLNGEIGWSIFPVLGLTLGDAKLANAPGFGNEPFAQLDKVSVKVALMPLLQKKVEAEKVIVEGARLNLEKNAAGADNWSSLSQAGSNGQTADGSATESTGSALPPVEIHIKGVELNDARLSYRDAQAGTDVTIDPLNLSTGPVELGKPITLKANANVQQGDMTALINLDGTVAADLDNGRYSAQNLKLSQRLSGAGFPADGLLLEQTLTVNADLPAEVINIPQLTLDTLGVTLNGQLNVKQFASNLSYSGQLSSNTFSPRALLEQLGSPVQPMASDKALQSASLSFDLSGNANSASLQQLQATLDESTLSGQLQIADFAKQAMRFDLALDQINLDHYMAKASDSAPAAAGSAGAGSAGGSDEIALPVDALRALNIDGTAKVKTLTVNKLVFTDAALTLTANNGKLQLSPLSANAYNGSANITAALDVSGPQPGYSANIALKDVESGEILQTLFDDRLISGKANFTADIRTAGSSVSALTRGLNGSYAAKFLDGTIKGSNLAGKITDARNQLQQFRGKSSVTEDQAVGTEFSELSASGSVTNGVVSNKDLRIVSPVFQARGEGQADLPKERLDYTLSLADDGASKSIVFVPLQIVGPFNNLSFKLRLDELAKLKAKEALDAEKAKLKAKLEAEAAVREAELRALADQEKAKLQQKLDAEKARAQQKLDEQKAELQQKLDKETQKLEDKLKNQLGDKLKGLF